MIQLEDHEFAWLCAAAKGYAQHLRQEDLMGALMKDGFFHWSKEKDQSTELVAFAKRIEATDYDQMRHERVFDFDYKGYRVKFKKEPVPNSDYVVDWWYYIWRNGSLEASMGAYSNYTAAKKGAIGAIDGL